MGDDRADLDLLTEPTRRAIVGMLAERPRRASSIAEALRTSLAATSRHLRLLRDGGIVRAGRLARDGRVRLYMLHPQRTRPVMAWLAAAGLPIDDEDAPALPTSDESGQEAAPIDGSDPEVPSSQAGRRRRRTIPARHARGGNSASGARGSRLGRARNPVLGGGHRRSRRRAPAGRGSPAPLGLEEVDDQGR